jgi:arylsulfatase
MAVYAAMVDRMDQQIGRLLATLHELNKVDNTLVLFLSDNGACAEINNQTPAIPPGPMNSYRTYDVSWANASNTPFRRFKRDTYEGGICTPLIVKWPTVIQPGTITRQSGHVADLQTTFCELAGVAYPEAKGGIEIHPMEGRSLVPVFQGHSRDGHEWLFWEHLGSKAARCGNWKIVSFGEGDPSQFKIWELYDLATDRSETRNLAEKHPERVAAMAQAWRSWANRTGLE